jgi:hypothetical protein
MTWRTDDVTALTDAPPAAFLTPASYVFEGTQHVIYLGFTDSHIHELWWDDSGRHTEDLTAATGAPPAAGPLAAYAFEAQGTQHVIYEDDNHPANHIHELWSDSTGWHTDDLTAATGAPPGAGPLAAYAFEAQGTQHVIYEDNHFDRSHIHELWSDSTGWHTDDLTATTGAPLPSGGSLAAYAFEAQGTQHVIYQDATHIHELWSDRTGWHTDDLTAASGAPPPNYGSLAAYVSEAQDAQHVIYTAGSGADDHMHDLWQDSTGRHTDDLSAATGAPRGAGPFVAYPFGAQGTRHVFYVSYPDEHVYELWWDGNGPHADDLTAASGAAPVISGGTSPMGDLGLTGYAFEAQGTQHVFYVSYPDNHIHELWGGPAGPQQPGSLTSSTPSPTVTAGATPGNTSSPTGSTASASFVGKWRVHGASLTITETTATVFAAGACRPAPAFCAETDTMAVQSGDDKQLTLVVTAVTYTDETGATVPNPNPGPSTAVGDTTQLVWQAPGLLKQTVLHGFPGWTGGNPYWCGAGISEINHRLCGA